jgi:hypothetical protein
MNKETFKKHWHNCRSARGYNYSGNACVLALYNQRYQRYDEGHLSPLMSIMQRSETVYRVCPQCNHVRKESERYIWMNKQKEYTHTCTHCHPDFLRCTKCKSLSSPHEVDTDGLCVCCSFRPRIKKG